MKSAIVVGANGFIGSYLCKTLLREGIKVFGIIKSKTSDTERLDAVKTSKNFIMIYCDMHHLDSILDEFIGIDIDVLYFLAWQGITGMSRADYSMQLDNIKCLLDAILFADKIDCRRFVGAGTLAEIDVNNYSGLDGSTPNAVSTYGVAKISAHYMSKALCNQLKIEHVWAYISNTYGEGDRSNNFVNFAINVIKDDKPKDFTSGEQYYDFVHVEDIAQGLFKLGENGKKNYSYYIGSGQPKKLKEYIELIRNAINPNIQLNLGAIPFNGTLVPIETYDCKKICEDTGYVPLIPFEIGIRRLLEYMER